MTTTPSQEPIPIQTNQQLSLCMCDANGYSILECILSAFLFVAYPLDVFSYDRIPFQFWSAPPSFALKMREKPKL
jgi:hypothetical protein